MKNSLLLHITLLTGLLIAKASLAGSEEPSLCKNCEAIVILERSSAQALVDILQIISSMPLQGIIIDVGLEERYARVLVATLEYYARDHNINSFDVAQTVLNFVEDFGIQSISAQWRPQSNNP